MPNPLKNFVRSLIPSKVKEFVSYSEGDEYTLKIYSQEGEDILLKRMYEHSPPGLYVDVGAHHPFRFSNTKLLYDMGWRGINIEPNPDAIELFNKERPFDTNLQLGVSNCSGMLKYYRFRHPALNTFSLDVVKAKNETPIDVQEVKTMRLQDILSEHLDQSQSIDLMSIDVEGLDYEVLLSNDWSKYRPRHIFIEVASDSIEGLFLEPLHIFLKEKGYTCCSKLSRSALYAEQSTSMSPR